MGRIELDNVLCLDVRSEYVSMTTRSESMLLVDREDWPMDLWVKREDVAFESQVKAKGDFGRLVLNSKNIKSFDERRQAREKFITDQLSAARYMEEEIQRKRAAADRVRSGLAAAAAECVKKEAETRALEEAAKVDESDDAWTRRAKILELDEERSKT